MSHLFLPEGIENSLTIENRRARVHDEPRLRQQAGRLAESAALAGGPRARAAVELVRLAALELGIFPASIHDLYAARSRGDVPPDFTVPAMNLRALPFEAGRATFRAAQRLEAGPLIFEISRAEIAFTNQRPAEYCACILAAAIAEGYRGPVFLQGDHFQVSARRYALDPERELQALRDLIGEAIQAGFYNIDVDASTLVNLGEVDLRAQQRLNSQLTAQLTAYIRSLEPEGITISVGGEIGEVGGHNSTEPELRAFMDSYTAALEQEASGASGLSKISVQTGTTHGGVVLPDGSIAPVEIDFETLCRLSRLSRAEYGMAGAVQHGASTLPVEAFRKLVESEAAEVHLATSFTTTLFERLPAGLRSEMYAYLDEHLSSERRPGMTPVQFYHRARKFATGPFKEQLWSLDTETKAALCRAWEEQFQALFVHLSLPGARRWVDRTIRPVPVQPQGRILPSEPSTGEDLRDLSD